MTDDQGTSLAQEITAQIQLGLAGTVGKLSRQLRAIDRIAPKLKEGGIVRKVTVDREIPRNAFGISEAHRSVKAFGGLLYAVGAVSHGLRTAGGDIAHCGEESRLDIGEMSLLEYDRRLEWKTYLLVYDLLEKLFQEPDPPQLVILNVPLILGRDVYAQVLGEDEEMDAQLKAEVDQLKERIEGFWDRFHTKCFPYVPGGPKVCTIHHGRLQHPLKALQAKGAATSPDQLDADVIRLMKEEWVQVLSVGIEKLLLGILSSEHRTAAFERQKSQMDYRAFPKCLIEGGTLTFHYLAGLRSRPIHVETLGSAESWRLQGGVGQLDRLAADLMALTYFDSRKAIPLPLWYAQNAVQVVKRKGVLEFYRRETLRAMQEELVDRSWLAGWEEE